VIGPPPFEDGGLKFTVTWPLPALTETIVGAPGTAIGDLTVMVLDAELDPAELETLRVTV
jgi:hypothetical protein